MKRILFGNSFLILLFLISSFSLKAAPPVVSSVSIAAGNYKIGSIITVTIAADGTGYTVDAGTTINGVDVTGTFASAGGNNYTLTYTVGSGNTDRGSVGAIPINILIRSAPGGGNLNTYTTAPTSGGTVTIDANAPSITSVTSNASSAGVLKIGQTIVFTATMSVAETGLTFAPLTYNARTFSPTWATANAGATYTATYTVTSGDPDQGTALQLTGVTATDAAGNTSGSVSTSNVVKTIDANAPSITSVTSNANAAGVLKIGQTIIFTATMSSAETGLTFAPLTYNGRTLSPSWATSDAGATYTATYTVTSGDPDQGSALQLTGVTATDVAGNTSGSVSTANVVKTIDANAPVISSLTSNANAAGVLKIGQTIIFTATMSVAEPGLSFAPLTYNGGTLSPTWATSDAGATYTATYTVTSGDPDQSSALQLTGVTATDAAGNTSGSASTANVVKTIDANAPSITSVTSNANAAGVLKIGQTIIFTATMSSAETGLTFAPLTYNGRTLSPSWATSDAGATYTATYTVTSGDPDQSSALQLTGVTATDAAGNTSGSASTVNVVKTIDANVPTVAITLVSASPSTATSLDFTVTFSESVTGVDITDFVLATGSANDALGTISNLSGSGSTYTVTVSPITGDYASGTQAILNLDIVGSPGIADVATNSFGGSVTGDAQYLVDNTKPTVVQNDFTFNANGASAETVVFSISEPLNGTLTNNITGFTIGGGTGTTNPIGVYNSGNGTVTLTNGGADGTWGTGITVSYTPGNMSDLLGNTMLAIGATAVTVPNVTLAVGDIAFTNINTKTGSGSGTGSGNGFSFVLLKNLPASTKIFFTSRGWDGAQLQATGIDMTWTSPASVTNAGTEVYFNGLTFVNGSNATFGTTAAPGTGIDLDSGGDQILAYQGSLNSPLLFVAAININSDGTFGADNWNTAASVGTDVNRSALPPGLTEGTNAISLALLNSSNVRDNGQYKTSAVTQEGSAQQLRSAMCSTTNWNNQDNNAYGASGVTYKIRPVITAVTIPNATNYIVSGTPYTATITVHDDRGTPHTLLSSTIGGFSLSNLIRTNATTYTADFTVAEGGTDVAAASNISISVNLQSAQGNATAAVSPINTVTPFTTAIAQANDPIDANSPHVISINRNTTATTTTAYSGNTGTTATSVVFRITFSEDMTSGTLTAADFSIPTTGLTGSPSVSLISAVTGTSVFDVTVTGYTGTGTIGLNYRDSEVNVPGGSVTDLIGNPTKSAALAADGSLTGQTFSIVLPTPNSTAFVVSAPTITSNSITLTWPSPNAQTPVPSHFLVLATLTASPSFPAVADGTPVADGALAQNVTRVNGTNTWTFTGLQSGTSYDFIIYKYALSTNNSSNNIDFETINPGTLTKSTNSATLSTIALNSSPVSVSSIKNASGPANSVNVMTFTIYDDGQDPIVPNVMTLHLNDLSQETITFSLTEGLTLLDGASVTGFTSNIGVVANAIYSSATKTITLTNGANGTWNSATTISYSPTTGNAQFATLGTMLAIDSHPVVQVSDAAPVVITTNGAPFIVPAGVTSIQVEAWGGGGSAGEIDPTNWPDGSSGGGGGGAYSRSLLAVTPGASYNYTIGSGGLAKAPAICCQYGNPGVATTFGGSLVVAAGGNGGIPDGYYDAFNTSPYFFSTYGFGGSSSNGTGDVKYSGGDGGSGWFTLPAAGGGGGSSAGPLGNGISGTISCAGCGSVAGGNGASVGGGNGGTGFSLSSGGTGNFPGGGGGGTGFMPTGFGGAGANGQIRITYSNPTGGGTSDWVADDSPTKFSQLKITQGTGNDAAFSDWRNILAGAELFDGTNTVTGVINPTDGSDITFTTIVNPTPTAATDAGFITDANGGPSSKTYVLRVWLKTNLGSTLAATVDGLNLAFNVDPAQISYDDVSYSNQKSSRLVPTQPILQSGSEPVAVEATQLDFSTSPNATQLVLTDINSTSVAPDLSVTPVIRARDLHGNTDKDYSGVSITLSGAVATLPTTVTMTSGVAVFSGVQYQDSGTGTLTATTSTAAANTFIPTPGNSSAVTVNYSATSTITAGAFIEPATFSSLNTAGFVQAFDFKITDDNGSGGDGSPTRISQFVITQGTGNDVTNWFDAISQVAMTDGVNPAIFGTVNPTNFTFAGVNPNAFGFVGDNGNKTYRLFITLKSSLGGSLPSTIDNQNLVFEILDDNITLNSLSSAFTGAEATNSGATNIAVNVIATKLQFSTNPALSILVSKDISLQPPVPVVEALDVNNNRDLNYNSTTVTVTNSGTLAMSNSPGNASIVNGLLTFPNNFRINAIGTGITITVASTGPSVVTSATSTSTDIRVGNATTITAGALAEPGTISSLVDLTHTPAGLAVFDFDINDDPSGTPAGEDDGNPTQLNYLYITSGVGNTLSNTNDWLNAIAQATLSDGTNTVNFTSIDPSNYFYFDLSSATGQALGLIADNGTKTYTLKVWLKTALGGSLPTTIDGLNFVFDVQKSNIGLSSSGTTFATAPQTQNSGSGNSVVTVVATQLDFTTPSTATSASLNSPFAVTVEARDANANRDLNFTAGASTITSLTNATGATMTSTPAVVGSNFALGVFPFPGNFQFITGNNNDDVTLSITAGGITSVPAPAPYTPTITLSSSFESVLIVDPAFVPTPDLSYKDYQDITTSGTSIALAQFKLFDGDGSTNDADGAGTNIKDLKFTITNPANIRSLGIYKGTTLVQSVDNSGFTTLAGVTTVAFTSLSAQIVAPDNGSLIFTVRASFFNSSPAIHDNDQIQLHVTFADQNGGSNFFHSTVPGSPAPDGTYIGGVSGGAISASNVQIEVTATRLDFTAQPSAIEGIDQPIAEPIVQARDINGVVDLDHNFVASITSSVTLSSSSLTFVSGVLSFTGFQYRSAGDGTLTVTSNLLSSLTGGSVPCNHVDVINVYTTFASGGVVSSPNLAGGAVNKVIFGATFNAPYRIGAHPYLNKFTISFSNTITGVLKNFRVFESTDNSFGGDIDITNATIGGKITAGTKTLTIDFTQSGGVPRNLTSGGATQLSYFLMVDIDPTANNATPSIQPSITDLGYTDPTTNSNILTSNGSTYSLNTTNTIGATTTPAAYTFAAIFPPTLTSSNPANGQLNVDPNQPTIDLVFSVPVWTLDGVISLYDKATNTLVQTLTALNGQYAGGTSANLVGTLANPMKFGLPALQSNHVYYITITPAKFNGVAATNNVGIMDENANLFPGFSYSGTLYFKTANPTPPVLLSAATFTGAPNPSITNVSTTSAVINAAFDQQGTAFFMVLSQGASAPTNAQIKGSAAYPAGAQTGTFITRGNFSINQTNTISQFGLINPATPLTLSTTYNVWMYAENNALPTPFATAAPYGGTATNYSIGSAGPTLTFTTPSSSSTSVSVNAPIISICSNSYQTLNSPIIISEGNNSNFTSTGVQTFNLLLPSGFQFDVSTTGTAPTYGSIALLGADFLINSGSLKFINNSILQVSYTNNNTSTSSDNIIIYGLRVLATSTTSGNIVRLGGNALSTGAPTQILADLTPVANLNATDASTIDFTNSYSTYTYPLNPAPVTFIPDNYDDPNITSPLLVQLDPLPLTGDFGPSTFSGPGVNINQLSLTAVTLGNPFNIIVTHTDNNGCISNNPIQYTVYDHTKAIGGLLTEYGIVNTNFPGAASTNIDVKNVQYNNIVANYMLSMTADIPTTATVVNPANPLPTDQIIFGTDWDNLINSLPVAYGSSTTPANWLDSNNITHTSPHDPGNNPVFGQLYYDFSFDVSKILNANTLSGGLISEPYDNFKNSTPIQGNTFYSGGSLGFVEFTATYQSIANSILQFPLKQNVQFFLPAIPIVELGQSNQSFLDTNDPLNPVGSGNVNPVGATNSNKGTPVYCVQGGKINISGFPAATPGTSVGTFTLLDAQSLNPITPVANGFIDNGNGTATLDPLLITNGFSDIKIVYTYKDNSAPANTQSTGYQIIRIAPNPVAKFTVASIIGPNTPNVTSFCENQSISFDATSSTIATGAVTQYEWNFGDATNSTGSNLNDPKGGVGVADIVAHKFIQSASYSINLLTTSSYGCKSDPSATVSNTIVKVGAIPVVSFDFRGVSTADPITFTNTSGIASASSLGDGFARLDWDYGDGSAIVPVMTSPFNLPIIHNYAASGPNKVNLKVTSIIGCTNNLSQNIIILAREKPTPTASYLETFESINGKWQASSLPISSSLTNPASWTIGTPTSSVIKITEPSTNGSGVAKTSLTGTYNPKENSAWYSPSFDLSLLTRPMVSFNSFTQMESSDGVVLQYSVDDKNVADPTKVWWVIGQPGEGVDWLTDQGITAKPGNQSSKDYGWSGFDKAVWAESKHALSDEPAKDPLVGVNRVVFRFALASLKPTAADIQHDGFALDNFRIGERTRTILLENFTTTNGKDDATLNATIKSENAFVSTFVPGGLGTTVVKLNYHIGFTGTDPFNLDNPADPSARALYYNVKDVPWAFLDGGRTKEADVTPKFSDWGQRAYDTQTLQLGQSEISTTTPSVNTDGSIKFDLTVKALYDLPDNTVLHVAIIEKSILASGLVQAQNVLVKTGELNFDYVLKRMLPNASGTKFGTTLAKNTSRTFTGFEYYPDATKLYANANDLAIIVFLQNETGRNIYQTELITGFNDPPIVTGLENTELLEHVEVFPNPADKEIIIQLPGAAKQSMEVQLVDQVGKVVNHGTIAEGASRKTINSQDLAAGIYILQIGSGKSGVVRKKILVMHQD